MFTKINWKHSIVMELCLTGPWDELYAIQILLPTHFWQHYYLWLLNYNHRATYQAKSNSLTRQNTYLSRKIFWLVWLTRHELYLCMAHLETEKSICLKIPLIFNIYNHIEIILRNRKRWGALVFGKHIWKWSTVLSVSFPVKSKSCTEKTDEKLGQKDKFCQTI